jgi:hypothetical protein
MTLLAVGVLLTGCGGSTTNDAALGKENALTYRGG